MKPSQSWVHPNFAWIIISGILLFDGYRPCKSQEVDDGGDWRIIPRLSVGTTYSDNIRLLPAGEMESDIVLQIDPGVSVRKQGGRLNLRLDYTAQGLLYANNSDANTVNNNLLAFGTAELYQNHLFFDAYGSIAQVPISSGRRVDAGNLGSNSSSSNGAQSLLSSFSNLNLMLPNGNELFNPIGIFSDIALTDNQTTQSSFGISPYWRQSLGSWADMLLRYRYADNRYSGGGDRQIDPSSELSDSQMNTIAFSLASGRGSNVLKWNLNYLFQDQNDQQNAEVPGNENIRQELLAGELNYRLNKSWALAAKSGYVNNQSATYQDNRNGPYWGLGATWLPNRFYSLTGLSGLNYNEVTLRFNPSTCSDLATPSEPPPTSLQIKRVYQGVGFSPGVYWNGSFNHRTPYSTWSATYTQQVTTAPQLATSTLVGLSPDCTPIALDEQIQALIPGGPIGPSNQLFLQKLFNVTATYLGARNSLGFSAFGDNRAYQDPTLDQDIYGAGVIWAWRFAPRTASFLGTGWEHDTLRDHQQNDYWVSVMGLARVFTPDTGGLISYRYYQNEGEPSSESFRENRLNLRFSMKF